MSYTLYSGGGEAFVQYLNTMAARSEIPVEQPEMDEKQPYYCAVHLCGERYDWTVRRFWACGGTGNDWSGGGMTDGRGKKNRRTAEID